MSIEAKVNVTTDEDQESEKNELRIHYTGDGDIGAIATYEDAIKEYKSLSAQAKDIRNPITFDLQPIENYCGAKDMLLLKILSCT